MKYSLVLILASSLLLYGTVGNTFARGGRGGGGGGAPKVGGGGGGTPKLSGGAGVRFRSASVTILLPI